MKESKQKHIAPNGASQGSFMTVGARLAEERKRLGLSQGDFALKAGVSISTQKRYEIDEREAGTSYLEGVRKLGLDVTYVLTGSRRGSAGTGLDVELLAEFGLAVIKFFDIAPDDVSQIAADAEKAKRAEFYGRQESSDAHREINDHVEAFEELFFVHASELLRRVLSSFSIAGEAINQELLATAIEQIEQALAFKGKTFSPNKRAHLAAMVYKLSRPAGKVDGGIAHDLVSIAD